MQHGLDQTLPSICGRGQGAGTLQVDKRRGWIPWATPASLDLAKVAHLGSAPWHPTKPGSQFQFVRMENSSLQQGTNDSTDPRFGCAYAHHMVPSCKCYTTWSVFQLWPGILDPLADQLWPSANACFPQRFREKNIRRGLSQIQSSLLQKPHQVFAMRMA